MTDTQRTDKQKTLYWLYDRHGKPQFLAFDDYKRFIPHMAQTNHIGFWERQWLKVQNLYPQHAVTDRVYRSSWSKLTQALDTPITHALLSRTDRIKPNLYEGFIGTEDREFYVVAHRQSDDAILAVHQANFIHYYFNAYFTIIKPAQHHDHLILYPVIPHKPTHYKDQDIADMVLRINLHYQELYKDHTKPALDYVHLNLPSLLRQDGHMDVWRDVRLRLAESAALSSVPVHGRMSRQHIWGSDHNLPVLVQYDRAGWHVPFYDWLDVQCQDMFARGKLPPLSTLLTRLQQQAGLSARQASDIGLIYLLDQLAHDIQDKYDYKPVSSALQRAIMLKIKLVQQIMHSTTES